nr:hypothetical protein [Pseudopedobacter sp.]
MQSLSFSIVVTPIIAISLDILLYAILLHKATKKTIFKQFVFALILAALILNAVWEVLQIPLYVGGTYSWSHILFCLLASLADAIMVMLIFFGFAMIYKNALWIQNLNLSRSVFLILTGGVGAVLAETRHLSIGTWSYAETMPLIPIINVGLSPVLQFMILPLLIYVFSFKMVMLFNNDSKVI